MASNNIARLGVVLGLDTAEFTASIDKAILENRKLKNEITKDSNAAAAAIVQLKYATEDYGKALTQVDIVQREVSSGRFKNATSDLKSQLLQQAAALDAVKTSTKGASAGMTAFQQQSLMYQTTDFFTQIASGQSVMIAAIQQGGQLKDTMGGLGPMFKMLSDLITPFRVAMLGAASAIGVVAFAAYKGHEEFAKLRDDLILTGNFAGITHSQFKQLAKGLSTDFVASIGDAKNVLSQLVASGAFTKSTLESVGSTILLFSKISGLSADEAAKKLIPSLNGTATSAKSLNDQYHFLTMAQYLQIEALERVGKKQEAIVLTSEALKKSLSSVEQNLGGLEKAWSGLGKAASWAWDAMMGIGREDRATRILDLQEKINKVTEEIENRRAKGIKTGSQEAALKAFETELNATVGKERAALDAAEEKSKQGLKTQAEIEARNKAGGFAKDQANIQLLAKIDLDTKLAAAKEFANATQIIDLDANRAIATAKAEFNKKQIDEVGYYTARNTQVLNAQIAQIEQDRIIKTNKYKIELMSKEAAIVDDLLNENIKAQIDAINLVENRKLAAYSKFKTDKDALQYDKDRLAIQEKMMWSTERELKQEMLLLDVAREVKAVNEMALPDNEKALELQRIREREALRSLQIDAQDRMNTVQNFTGVVFSNMSTAIDNFVRTGKLSFKDFARSIIQDMIAMQMKAQALNMISGLGQMFSGSSYGSPSAYAGMGSGGVLPFADGGDPPVGKASLVGERGPELFVPKTAGTIVPNHQLSSAMGGGGQTINYNGPFIQSMSAIDTQSGIQFLVQNKSTIWAANQSAQRSLPMSK